MAETLLGLLNAQAPANTISESALIVVDAQREYLDGKLPLHKIDAALPEIRKLIERARERGSKIYFIRHIVGSGSPVFDPDSKYFQIIDEVAPKAGETIIDKHYPSSFAGTTLHEDLQKSKANNLIVTGFMTHACISTTVRSAAELGYRTTVVGGACATRDLPGQDGNTVSASQIHSSTLAALSDLFATIVKSADEIKD